MKDVPFLIDQCSVSAGYKVRQLNFDTRTLDFGIQFWHCKVFYIEQTKSEIRSAIQRFRAAGDVHSPMPITATCVPEVLQAH